MREHIQTQQRLLYSAQGNEACASEAAVGQDKPANATRSVN